MAFEKVILFNENGDYYGIVAQAKDDFDKYLERCKKSYKSIQT